MRIACSWRESDHHRLSNLLPLHPLIHHQGDAILKLHYGRGQDGFALHHIQMEAVMQREYLALHARCDHGGLAFDLDGFILPDDPVADFKVEGFFSPGPCLIIAGVADGCFPTPEGVTLSATAFHSEGRQDHS